MSGRATAALLAIGVRYRFGVQGVVEQQLARWEGLAHEIPDPALRSLALAKLRAEGDNARSAAMLAAFAPRRRRAQVARAIVASEVLFDYLDGRTEASFAVAQALEGRRALYRVFTSAFGAPTSAFAAPRSAFVASRSPAGAFAGPSAGASSAPLGPAEHAYALALAGCIAEQLRALPSAGVVAARIATAATRAAEAQVRMHATAELGGGQLERWARRGARGTGLGWSEYAAGCAASVLCIHALLARAAHDSDGGPDAAALDGAYLRLATLAKGLDGLVDGEDGPLSPAAGRRARLLSVDAQARVLTDALGPRHAAIVCGLLAHYSCIAARREPAAAILAQLAAGRRTTVALARLVLTRRRPRGGRAIRALRAIPAALLSLLVAAPADASGRFVRDEGALRYARSSGSQVIDEGGVHGTLPGYARVRFTYNGNPTVYASFTLSGRGWSLSGSAGGRLHNPYSPTPSFRGRLTITSGSGRYAHARGGGELFGVFNRRTYGLIVQTLVTLRS